MTINEILVAFRQFSPRLKTDGVDKNTQVSESDIDSGKYFQQFRGNEKNFSLIVRGFAWIDGKVAYVQPVADSVELRSDGEIPPCGGGSKLFIEAKYSLVGTFADLSSVVIRKASFEARVGKINIIGDSSFTYDNQYLMCQSSNDTGHERKAIVSTTYYLNGKPYECSLNVVQKPNAIGPWKTVSEETDGIRIVLDHERLGKEGGKSSVSVLRDFKRTIARHDLCGIPVESKSEEGLSEDITKKCLITISNKKSFSLLNGYVVADKQELEAKERACVVTARYKDFTCNVTITQEEGSKVETEYVLATWDGKKSAFIDLDTAAKGASCTVELQYRKILKAEGECRLSIGNPPEELKLSSDSPWLSASMKGASVVEITTLEANSDRDNDREGEITVETCDGKHTVKIIISQKAASAISDEYEISCEKYEPFKSGEIGDVSFSVTHITKYDDGSSDVSNDFIGGDVRVVAAYDTTDPNLSISGMTYMNGRYYPSIVDDTKSCISEVKLSIIPFVVSSDDKVLAKGETIIVKTMPNEVITYQYELCFDEHNKYKEVTFSDKNPIAIPVNSVMHTLSNGVIKNTTFMPYKVICIDENRKPISDDMFSNSYGRVSVSIESRPKVDTPASSRYIIKQDESGMEIEYKLSYQPISSKKVMLTVMGMRQNDITCDIWTEKGGEIVIDGLTEIPLNPCWMNPNMGEKVDVMFNGAVELKTGMHHVTSQGVYALNGADKTRRELKLEQDITVDERTNSILLKFDI